MKKYSKIDCMLLLSASIFFITALSIPVFVFVYNMSPVTLLSKTLTGYVISSILGVSYMITCVTNAISPKK